MGADKKTVQVDVKTTNKSRTFLLKLKSSQKDDEQTLLTFELKSDRVAVLTDQSSESVRMVPGGSIKGCCRSSKFSDLRYCARADPPWSQTPPSVRTGTGSY